MRYCPKCGGEVTHTTGGYWCGICGPVQTGTLSATSGGATPPAKTYADGWRDCREAAAARLEKKGYRVSRLHMKRGDLAEAVLVRCQYEIEANATRNLEPPEDNSDV